MVVQTQAIDAVLKATRDATDETKTREGRKIVEELVKLKYELQHNRTMTYVPRDAYLFDQSFRYERDGLPS